MAADQKAILLVDVKQAIFNGSVWSGPCPKVAVYDHVFINQNVFSGGSVSHDHLKKQYGLVVGERGVALMQEIIALDEEAKTVNATEITAQCFRDLGAQCAPQASAGKANSPFSQLREYPLKLPNERMRHRMRRPPIHGT